MAAACGKLGLDHYNLMGTSFGGKAALWLASQQPERVTGLVLESPAAIRPEGGAPPPSSPEALSRLLYAYPERQPPAPAPDPAVLAKQQKLVSRLRGPNRDRDLETQLSQLKAPTLVVFGTRDRMIPPEMGHFYKELMPNCHLVFVYDAGHAIGAERPEAFVEVVADFLDRHEAFVISRTETVIHP